MMKLCERQRSLMLSRSLSKILKSCKTGGPRLLLPLLQVERLRTCTSAFFPTAVCAVRGILPMRHIRRSQHFQRRLWKSCVGRRLANDPSSPPLSLIEAFFSKEQRKHFFHCSNFVAASTVSSRNPQARGVASRRIPRAGAERDTIKFDDRRDDQHPGCGR